MLAPHTLFQQYSRSPCTIYLQLCKPHQIVELCISGTWKIIRSMDWCGHIGLTYAGAAQYNSIVVVQLFVVVSPLIVYKLARVSNICSYSLPIIVLATGSPILYIKYTVLWVLVLRVEIPYNMPVAFSIDPGVDFGERYTHLNQISSVLSNHG